MRHWSTEPAGGRLRCAAVATSPPRKRSKPACPRASFLACLTFQSPNGEIKRARV